MRSTTERVRTIRPRALFDLVKLPGTYLVKMPEPGEIRLLELFSLFAGMEIVGAKRVFEFGTWKGVTTWQIARNHVAEVLTLDRDATQVTWGNVGTSIVRLTGDSRTFDFSPWHDTMDMVFIDGGHDYETVMSDSQNAFEMVRKDQPAVVFWHDYGNGIDDGNDRAIEELARERRIVHIEESWLCVWFNEASGVRL